MNPVYMCTIYTNCPRKRDCPILFSTLHKFVRFCAVDYTKTDECDASCNNRDASFFIVMHHPLSDIHMSRMLLYCYQLSNTTFYASNATFFKCPCDS